MIDNMFLFSDVYKGGIQVRGACNPNQAEGIAHICERVSGFKVISDDFSAHEKCNLYLTEDFISLPYAMIFQVYTITVYSTSWTVRHLRGLSKVSY